MTELEYLAIAYALFIFLIGLEAGVSLWKKNGRYQLDEMFGNIGHGIVYQTFDYATKASVMVPFILVSTHFAIVELPMDAWWGWLLAIVIFDFINYWLHRHSHEVNAMWAVHAVHHAAEDYNLAAALRQPLLSQLYTWIYRLPMALFMPVEMFIGVVVIDYIYQFVQHTQYVPRLGPVGWLMNTPSHHRVHHGRNEKYLDRNYGAIFIIWDRLFGTFQKEEEPVDFGITRPLHTVDPIWGNLVFWKRLVAASRQATTLRSSISVWLKGPGDIDIPTDNEGQKQATKPTATLTVYVIANAAMSMPALPALIYFGEQWGLPAQLALSAFILTSTSLLIALIEGRPWARKLEPVRAVVFAVGMLWLVPASLDAISNMPAIEPVAAEHTSDQINPS